jgi:hypothetical protein
VGTASCSRSVLLWVLHPVGAAPMGAASGRDLKLSAPVSRQDAAPTKTEKN